MLWCWVNLKLALLHWKLKKCFSKHCGKCRGLILHSRSTGPILVLTGDIMLCFWHFTCTLPLHPGVYKRYPPFGSKLSLDICSRHYPFREGNSFPRAQLDGNCEPQGTDSVQRQVSQYIFTTWDSLNLLPWERLLQYRNQLICKTKWKDVKNSK